MSDVTNVGSGAGNVAARAAIAGLEAQISGIESMLPGAKMAGIDTRDMERTLASLKSSLESLKSIPGVG
jgi:hypothetical protein